MAEHLVLEVAAESTLRVFANPNKGGVRLFDVEQAQPLTSGRVCGTHVRPAFQEQGGGCCSHEAGQMDHRQNRVRTVRATERNCTC